MKVLVVALVLALCVLHHDIWWWDIPGGTPADGGASPPGGKDGLVFGFLPIGLAWHAGISVAASLVWLLAVTTCWPQILQEEEAGA